MPFRAVFPQVPVEGRILARVFQERCGWIKVFSKLPCKLALSSYFYFCHILFYDGVKVICDFFNCLAVWSSFFLIKGVHRNNIFQDTFKAFRRCSLSPWLSCSFKSEKQLYSPPRCNAQPLRLESRKLLCMLLLHTFSSRIVLWEPEVVWTGCGM